MLLPSGVDGVINVARDLRKAIEPLLFEYQVDLTLHGKALVVLQCLCGRP